MKASTTLIAALLFFAAGCNPGADLTQQQYQCAKVGQQLHQQDLKDNQGGGVADVAYHFNVKLNKCLYEATLVFPDNSSDHEVRDAYENKVLVFCHLVPEPNPATLCLNKMNPAAPPLDIRKAQDLMTNLMSE